MFRAGIPKKYLYINVFTAWQAAGRYEEAEEALNLMEQAWPDSYIPHALRAMLMIAAENIKEAFPAKRERYSKITPAKNQKCNSF